MWVSVAFVNNTFYTSYKLIFPVQRIYPGVNEMQYQEVELGGQTIYQSLNVSPANGEEAVVASATLQWKAPRRDPNNLTLPNLDTEEFVVYCDPNETRLRAATYDSHASVPYYSDQVLTGVIGDDPVQSFDPSPDLLVRTFLSLIDIYWHNN